MRRGHTIATLATLLLASGGAFAEKRTGDLALSDLAGTVHALDKNPAQRVRVFVFVGTECPISRAYVPTLNQLAKSAASEGSRVDFFAVLSDPSTTRSAARAHFAEWHAEFTVLDDATGKLARELRPEHVPEAFVLDAKGRQIYRGAIDNAFADLGRRRPKVDEHFLVEAIAAAVAGRSPKIARTEAVGCLFENPPAAARGR